MPKYDPDPTDPLAPTALRVPGDPTHMAECIVEEYLLMGYGDDALLALFRDPFYQGIHPFYQEYGEAGIRALIAEVRGVAQTEETPS